MSCYSDLYNLMLFDNNGIKIVPNKSCSQCLIFLSAPLPTPQSVDSATTKLDPTVNV